MLEISFRLNSFEIFELVLGTGLSVVPRCAILMKAERPARVARAYVMWRCRVTGGRGAPGWREARVAGLPACLR